MNHNEFSIGIEFWCGNKRWRCTDVGSRTIVAISLEQHEITQVKADLMNRTRNIELRRLNSDSDWLEGPPYAIVENVFDENDIEICALALDQRGR